jgi:hypothetical protein
MQADLEHACIRTICIRHVRNTFGRRFMGRLNYRHPVFATQETEQDQIVKAMGGVPGACIRIEQNSSGPQQVFAMRPEPNVMYLQSYYVKTMTLINENNIDNGILLLNAELCAKSQLPDTVQVWLPDEESGKPSTTEIKVQNYFLVPAAHVLAWPLHTTDDQRRKQGIFAMEMRVNPTDPEKSAHVLYFIVCDHSFALLRAQCVQRFVGTVDVRPLSTVGFEFVPSDGTPLDQNEQGQLEIQVNVTYTVWPSLPSQVQVNLMPTLDPEFPPYTLVLARQHIARSNEKASDPRGNGSGTK